MATKAQARSKSKKPTVRRAKAHDRRLLAQAEREEREIVDRMNRHQVVSWHRLQATRLRRAADGLRVPLRRAGMFRELLSLAVELDEMGNQYLMGKVVRP